MEQSKWIMVRRETTFEKFKRKIKNFIFNFLGIEVVNEKKQPQKYNKNKTKSQNTIMKNNIVPKNNIIQKENKIPQNIIVPVNIKTESKLKQENINIENNLDKEMEITIEIIS